MRSAGIEWMLNPLTMEHQVTVGNYNLFLIPLPEIPVKWEIRVVKIGVPDSFKLPRNFDNFENATRTAVRFAKLATKFLESQNLSRS
jgi:hypothetical protein